MVMRIKKSKCFVVISLFILLSFSAPLVAQDSVKFEPYASIRMIVAYHNQSEELTGTDADTDLTMGLSPVSRFGGNFTLGEKLSGKVEMALKDTITLRHAYATYTFGFMDLMVGQNWTPNSFGSNEISDGDNGSAGFGATDDVRKKQVRITIAGAYVSLIQPVLEPGIGSFDATTIDSVVPEVVIGYEYTSDMLNIGAGFAYQTYTLDDGSDTGVDGESIDTMMGFLHGTVNAGMFSLLFNFGAGTNFGNIDIASGKLDYKAQLDGTDSIADTTCIEGYIEFDIKAGDPIVRIGGGYAQADNDTWTEADAQWQAYINVEIPVDKGFSITPEFCYRDYMKDENDADEGSEWFAGVKLQADFK